MLSPRMPLWVDEVYSTYAIDQPTWADFWGSFSTNTNTVPPGYFFLMWAVGKVMPLSTLALRLFSTLCSAGAFALVWGTARRHAGFFAATVGVGAGLLTSSLFLQHCTEVRFYGLYLLAVAWTIWNLDTLCTREPARGTLVRNTLSHALGLATAYFAGLFSAAVLAAVFVRDRVLGAWRPKVWLSIVLGWFPVLLCLPFLLTMKDVSRWIRKPGPAAAFHPFDAGIGVDTAYFVLAGFVALLVMEAIRRSSAKDEPREPFSPPLHLVLVAALFVAEPYGLLALSWAGKPMLIERYSLPVLLGIALLFAMAVRGLLPPVQRIGAPAWTRRLDRSIRTGVIAALLIWPVADAVSRIRSGPPPKPKGSDDPAFVREAPAILTSDPHAYFVRHYQAGGRPEVALGKPFLLVAHSPEEKAGFLRFYPALKVATLDEALAAHPRFALIYDWAEKGVYSEWLELELRKRKGEYVVEREESLHNSKWLLFQRREK